MSTALTKMVNQVLPASFGGSATYNRDHSMFVSETYTSAMGHGYFQGLQLSNRIAVVYDIGRGGWGSNPHFLNGVTVYNFNGNQKQVIGRWFPSSWAFYSDGLARRVAEQLLVNFLKSQAKMLGASVSDSEINNYASAQIQAAVSNRPMLSA